MFFCLETKEPKIASFLVYVFSGISEPLRWVSRLETQLKIKNKS